MGIRKLPAVFMRGGTSKALIFHQRDLPADRTEWNGIFQAAMGSPDPNRRQLNGMGGGVTSVSKVCVVGPPTRDDADVDYLFCQVQVTHDAVDMSGNCGNMSSAIGPFAVDEALVDTQGSQAAVRIHNVNTGKIIVSRFPIDEDGRFDPRGELLIPGVHGTGSEIRLEFIDLGGATTGKLLPTGKPVDQLEAAGETFETSMVDAANACAFVTAQSLGLTGTELPYQLEADQHILRRLANIREAASIGMGITGNLSEAAQRMMTPFILMVGPPADFTTLSGENLPSSAIDIAVRALSSGQPHRALPLTTALCTAVAARIEGSVVHRAARHSERKSIRLGMPSGVLEVDATVSRTANGWLAERGVLLRTARRLFDGQVYC